jgi:hypothetical protein
MPYQSAASGPGNASLSPEARAAALWTFVQAKMPRFTLDDALEVVQGLDVRGDEDPKALAKRLRVALRARGVGLKHTHALQAASRLAGESSFHTDERVQQPKLRFMTFNNVGVHVQERSFAAWDDLAQFVREVLDELTKNGLLPLNVATVRFTGTDFQFWAPMRGVGSDGEERSSDAPLFAVSGLVDDWLGGAPAFIEKVRRHLEERGKAVLDGCEVIHLCTEREPVPRVPGDVTIADVPNTELVLLREDNEDDPHSGFEIARGDELTCWHQLELSMRDDRTNELPSLVIRVPEEGVGAWFVNERRYVWARETLHPKEYVPGRSVSFIGPHQCDRLLRRYRLAKRIHGDTFKHHPLNKSLDYLSGVPDGYRVDQHYLLRQLKDAGLTWEQCVEEFSPEPLEMKALLPVGFVFQVLQKLKLEDPNKAFALPNISEMQRVDDDGLLRALLPRVQSVRAVRPWGMSDEDKKALDEALSDFGAGRRLQVMTAGGSFRTEQEMPYLLIAGEATDLRGAVESLGLTMYAAVMPHLLSTKGLVPETNVPSWPWALGYALFFRFQRQGDAQ